MKTSTKMQRDKYAIIKIWIKLSFGMGNLISKTSKVAIGQTSKVFDCKKKCSITEMNEKQPKNLWKNHWLTFKNYSSRFAMFYPFKKCWNNYGRSSYVFG